MFRNKLIQLTLISGLSVGSALTSSAISADTDKNLWLEDVDGKKALAWVKTNNQATDQRLGTDPLYQDLYQDALSALNSKDKLLSISQRGDWIYNYHKSTTNPRGVYRRTLASDFNSGKPSWQTVLDIDALSKTENTQWVFKGMDCLQPEFEQCLVRLSPGGTDAAELREFNSKTLKFVKDGFNLPVSKMNVSWKDHEHLFIGTDFGKDSMTESGYPRQVRLWHRGRDINKAQIILNADKKSVFSYGIRVNQGDSPIDLLVEAKTFWTNQYYQFVDGKKVALALPDSAEINNAIDGKLVVTLQKDWDFKGNHYQQGSVLLVDPNALKSGAKTALAKGAITQLIKPNRKAIIENITVTKNGILVVVLEDVKSRVYQYQNIDNQWQSKLVNLPKKGQIQIESVNPTTGEFFVRYEDFITPPTLYSVDADLNAKVAMQQSATFDSSQFKVEQYFSTSKDGTQVPYFVVMNKNTKFNAKNPTHIFAYGGFRNSVTPSYSGSYEDLNGAYGKMWLQRGGVYVVANIRGGGEYGPAWHAAALLENRHKAFEDFESVAEDLIKRKITSPKHLGIEGRSNGGLLVGATMTRRPDLYGAVICGVPLLDMQRYHKLLAGASWMAEFGDPDTADWQFLKEYSPYQNLKAEQQYPATFFYTSTRDDRVHPGHARKMAAKMQALGQTVEYYENMEGGHAGSATSEQLAKRIALAFTHLWKNLK
jgi:prolyl oligopeptidase